MVRLGDTFSQLRSSYPDVRLLYDVDCRLAQALALGIAYEVDRELGVCADCSSYYCCCCCCCADGNGH